jgi:uncharacterized membrane protein YtjA (UPF0391 family)
MLKRAIMSAVVGLIAALFGFSGVLDATAPLVQVVFYICAAFCGLSLLLCLFEGPAQVRVLTNQPSTTPAQPLNES